MQLVPGGNEPRPSSALVIAALRAWSRWFGVPLAARRVAALALEVENEVLGIRAGPLDRVVQAHDGLLAMDFAEPFAADAAEQLDPATLPPMLLAWQIHMKDWRPSNRV